MELKLKKGFALLIDNVISSLLDYQVEKLTCIFNKYETKNIKHELILCEAKPNLKAFSLLDNQIDVDNFI